jgi:threonylcarbamoyladenosine tRNA methylthiotransferase MtaB
MGEMEEVDDSVAAGPGWLGEVAQKLKALSWTRDALELPENPDELPIEQFSGHTRAFLKVQDGCDIGCSYCIVPSLRKAPRDKDLELIRHEAEALTEGGHKEIVVSGVSVGLYGRDNGGTLADVLRTLLAVKSLERLRLSSLHPAELTDELLDVWASSPKMMPHVHLPLQSGSDKVLAAMRRGYTISDFMSAVERARSALNDPAFTTDVIVGFPGETDADFSETIEACRGVGFSRVHIFTYSPRPGTRAADMPDHLAAGVRQKRMRELRKVGRDLSRRFHATFVGRTVQVLTESVDGDSLEGYSEHYVPVRFEGRAEDKGKILPVRILEASADFARGVAEE